MSLTSIVTKEDLKNQYSLLDLISKYTHLTRKGNNYVGLCPFHNDNKVGSFSYDENKGVFSCFSCGKSGNDIFSFIMCKENMSFREAFSYLEKDYKPNLTKVAIIKPKKNLKSIIDFTPGPFTPKHLEYFECLKVTESYLESKGVYAVKYLCNGTLDLDTGVKNLNAIKINKNEFYFAFHAKDIDECKILRLGDNIAKEDKWRNTVPNDYLWYYNDYVNEDIGFLVKSVKDCIILQNMGYNAISAQNELSATILDNGNVERINKIFKKVIVLYGADEHGVEQCKQITSATGWDYFNTPKHLYEDYKCEDPYDFLKLGFSYKILQNKINLKIEN